jgi:8-oxo-dGTP diphosphatase
VTVYIVRHARAGQRSRWVGDDSLRPLDDRGQTQATGIADALEHHHVSALWSSPFRRCVQTLEPLGVRLRLDVHRCEALSEGADLVGAIALVRSAPAGTVMCTHGDLLPEIIAAVIRRGASCISEPDWRKGVTWVLDRGEHESSSDDESIADDDLSGWTLTVWAPPRS